MVPASASASAAAPKPQQKHADTVLVDCTWKPQVRPTDFMLACGDGNSLLTSLKWSHWGPSTAVATGTSLVNDCKPYCAAGKFRSYRVTVRLDRPQSWTKHQDRRHYSRITLTYPQGHPDAFHRVVTTPLWN
ncbi:hypothetical protein [Streptomyces sp. NPDC017964]|uniref:hypothetical protein n=1 Tax=Streptomyces sp. NPDC017964 TaxID=3365022 RepID=UPI0037A3C224